MKNRVFKTFPVLMKHFDISFDFMPTKWIGGWASVLHFTEGGNCCGYGQRIPGVWVLNKRVHIVFALNGTGNFEIKTSPLSLNKWYHFRLTQTLQGNKYWYAVYMNNKKIFNTVNRKPQDFKNVKVYIADPWHNAQNGFVKNLKVSGEFLIYSLDSFLDLDQDHVSSFFPSKVNLFFA